MKTIFVVMTAVSLFSFVLLQSANIQTAIAQSANQSANTQSANTQSANATSTKFRVTSVSVFLGKDNEIKQIQNSTRIVPSLDEALQLTKAGLAAGKGISKTLVVTNNSTQLVDGDTALVVIEKALRSLSEKTHGLHVISSHGFWVYLGGGDSYHIQVVAE
jgi:hypothetical protein